MADAKRRDPAVEAWLQHIAAYEREFKKWEARVDKILKRFRDENRKTSDSSAKFNILWSNVQTLVPATFSKLPQPDVSRRFLDNDPIGRVAALILERALEFEIHHYPDYRATMKQSVQDRFLGGRGTAWARYEPHMRAAQTNEPVNGVTVTEDVDEPNEEIDYECAPVDYVHWRDFGHTIARTWEEVTGVWRRVYMTRSALVDRFGKERGGKIPLDATPDDYKKGGLAGEADYSRALIYEIWDKETKTALWLSKSLGEMLDERDDPLEVEGFFPCPRPLYATVTNESLVPVPDFTLYQDQAQELDLLADRIDGLVQALQVKGAYNAAVPELGRIFTEATNGKLIPVSNWAMFAEKQGLKGSLDIVDLSPIAEALREAYMAFEQIKNQIYEITGISDIIRGETSASETATAQQLKGQYANLRLRSMQDETAHYATELLQLKAQIMCKKFDPQTLLKISAADQLLPADQQLLPQALALLVGPERLQSPDAPSGPNPLRAFRVEISTDSLVQIDEDSEKQRRTEFLGAVGNYFKQSVQVIETAPQLVPLMLELGKFVVTGFKVGRQIEGLIDQTIEQMKQVAANPQQKPDPEMAKVQAQQQSEQMRLQSDQQAKQMDLQMEQQKMQIEEQGREREQQQQAMLEDHRNQLEAQREAMKLQHDTDMQSRKEEFDRWKAELDAQTKIAVAEIAAQTTISTAQLKAAQESADSSAQTEEMSKGNDAVAEMGKHMEKLHKTHVVATEALSKAANTLADSAKEMAKPKKRIARKDPESGTWTSEEQP